MHACMPRFKRGAGGRACVTCMHHACGRAAVAESSSVSACTTPVLSLSLCATDPLLSREADWDRDGSTDTYISGYTMGDGYDADRIADAIQLQPPSNCFSSWSIHPSVPVSFVLLQLYYSYVIYYRLMSLADCRETTVI